MIEGNKSRSSLLLLVSIFHVVPLLSHCGQRSWASASFCLRARFVRTDSWLSPLPSLGVRHSHPLVGSTHPALAVVSFLLYLFENRVKQISFMSLRIPLWLPMVLRGPLSALLSFSAVLTLTRPRVLKEGHTGITYCSGAGVGCWPCPTRPWC